MPDYFSTLLGISTQIVAIMVAFYAAYNVYLRQQRDKYREKLVKDFQRLDKLILRWSLLEEYGRPDWSPPIGKYFQILEKESWTKSVMEESLKEPLSKLENEFMETRKRETELRTKFGGHLTAGIAIYLKVKFALNDLISTIYREFPQPPGDFKVAKGTDIPIAVKSFIKWDFPNNRKNFIKWVERFDLFSKEIYQVYYRIRPIVTTLKKMHEESMEQTARSIKMLEATNASWAINSLKESMNYSIAEINYYEQVFHLLFAMKYKVDEIVDKVATYSHYCYRRKWETFISFLAMIATGIVIPFLALFSNIYWLPVEIVEIAAGIGLVFSTVFAIIFLYMGIR